jgi:hypothetical protein
LTFKGTFSSFIQDDDFHGEVWKTTEDANTTLLRLRSTEFENWALRIILGAGGTRARNAGKAVSAKHALYTKSFQGDPDRHCHKAVWMLAKPLVGTDDSTSKDKSVGGKASSSKDGAKESKKKGAAS